MHDFFTELDSDLLDAKKTQSSPETPIGAPKKHSPRIEENRKVFLPSPILKKPEPREVRDIPEIKHTREKWAVRESREKREEPISHFSVMGISPSIFPETKPQLLPTLQKGQTRVVTIAGYNEIGKNMNMCQYGEEILLLDAGIQFPESDGLGAKYSLPDITFLFPIKKKIVGIVITNGHPNHIGGLKHILPALGYPKVYATKLTIGMIKRQLEDVGMLQKVDLRVVNPDTDGIFPVSANIKIELFRENLNIPDAVGMYIETPNAKLVYTGDFTFPPTLSINPSPHIAKLQQIGARGIDLLMSDSANSLKEGPAKTEAEIGWELQEIIGKTEGRIIIAISSGLIGRIGQIVEAAESTGRTVFLNGRSMVENANIGRELGYIQCHPQSLQRMTGKIDSLPENRQIILTTGSCGEEDSELSRIANAEHPIVKIHPGDTVILSPISMHKNERKAATLMNTLIRLGATLFTKDGMNIQTGGHASKEEQRMMITHIRPRNFMPVHGELFMRVAHKKTATMLGLPDKNIFLLDNGSILDIDLKGAITKNTYKLQMEEIIVDGYGIGIATSHVIEARSQMMKAGVVTIVFKADEKTGTLLGHLKLETRGLVYLDEVREVHKMIIKKARASYEDTLKDVPDIEEKDLIKIIRRDLEAFLFQKIERNPVIIPMILYM